MNPVAQWLLLNVVPPVAHVYIRLLHLTMRIMTRSAANARIECVVTSAVGEPVRLKTNVLHAALGAHGNLSPRTVTAAAEIRHLFSRQTAEFAHSSRLDVAALDGFDMVFRRSMAAFTLDPWDQTFDVDLVLAQSSRGVTREATPDFCPEQLPPGSFFQVFRI